ncbi:MAG TPA: hypothetical protein VF552_10310 [Allosphingosinicella sp.]|jgi:hypothetical protein
MIAALLLASFIADTPPPATVRAVEARLARCGIAARQVAVHYERELQSDVVVIGGRGIPSDETLACVAEASMERGWLARFADPDADTRYGDAWADLLRRRGLDLARAWLRERGLLETLPVYEPQREALAGFARRLEAFCGIAPGAALRVESGLITFAVPLALPRLPDEQLNCIANAAVAAGVGFGFLGNEAAEAARAREP